jgi:hypothetical protein
MGKYTGFCHLLQRISLPSIGALHAAAAFAGPLQHGRTRTGIPAKSCKRQITIQGHQNLCPLRPLRLQCETRPRGQRWTAIPGSLPDARASNHFAETCGRSDRSGRSKVNDSRRVWSGDGREVRGCVWPYAPGRVDEEWRPGVRRIVVFPTFPRPCCHRLVIAGSRRSLDLLLSSSAPMSASRLRSFSCYITLLFNRLRVFRIANTSHLGRGGGQERWLRMGPSEKDVAHRGSILDEIRMSTACFARAPQRYTSRPSKHLLLTFQGVTPLKKTRNQLYMIGS